MKLCLQSPLPLDELESYAKSIFNAIPAREGLSEPKTNPFLTKTTGFLPVEAPQLVKYVPINDEITLDFWFSLPRPVFKNFRYCLESYTLDEFYFRW